MKYLPSDRESTNVDDRRHGQSAVDYVTESVVGGFGILSYLAGYNRMPVDKEGCAATKICPADDLKIDGNKIVADQIMSHTDWDGEVKTLPGTVADVRKDVADSWKQEEGYLPTFESDPMERNTTAPYVPQPAFNSMDIGLPGLTIDFNAQ